MTPVPREGPLVASWTVTGGTTAVRADLDGTTLVTAQPDRSIHDLRDEKRRVVEHCQGGVLGIAEITGAVGLPSLTVTLVLVTQLLQSRHLRIHLSAQAPSIEVLEEVLHGLQNLLVTSSS